MKTVMIALTIAAGLSSAASAEVIRCAALDAVGLNEEGLMSQTPIAKHELERHATFTADLATGVVEGPGIGRDTWPIADVGSPRDDTVFVAVQSVDAATDDFFRFRNWSIESDNPPIRFQRYFGGTVISGTCEPAS
jgi:hypothetical protein